MGRLLLDTTPVLPLVRVLELEVVGLGLGLLVYGGAATEYFHLCIHWFFLGGLLGVLVLVLESGY